MPPHHTALFDLIAAMRHVGPGDIPRVASEHAQRAGAAEANLYLIDLQQRTLVPFGAPGEPQDVEGSLPGMAYRSLEPVEVERDGRHHLWLPLLDGTTRIGVAGLVFDEMDDEALTWAKPFADIVTMLILTRSAYGDVIAKTRRTRPVDLATELRYAMLPPPSFATPAFHLVGALEPAYEVAGDGFDYAYDEPNLHFSISDAVGHGLLSSRLANLATATLRHARFWELGLPSTYRTTSEVLHGEFGPEMFVTAQLGVLDTARGRLDLVNAGHPPPLLLRGQRFAVPVDLPADPPLGAVPGTDPHVTSMELEPGDVLLFYTDGVTEARSPDGEPFGAERLEDFLVRVAASEDPPTELLRRLVRQVLSHTGEMLRDDACLLLLQWHGAGE